MPQQLCAPKTVEGITAARESVENYLRVTFDEIGRLQKEPGFLENIERIQEDTRGLETWKVQREQLAAVESCVRSCTCDEGSRLVIAEYNQLVRQAEEGSGLLQVPLGLSVAWVWAGLAIAAALGWMWWRRRG